MLLVLDGGSMDGEAAFHDVIDRAALDAGFEGYGRNLDALWDVLTNILPTPVEISWVNTTAARAAIGPRFDRIVQVLREAEAKLGPAGLKVRLEP
jgi:RNAse (barnase) inhibitor barstar